MEGTRTVSALLAEVQELMRRPVPDDMSFFLFVCPDTGAPTVDRLPNLESVKLRLKKHMEQGTTGWYSLLWGTQWSLSVDIRRQVAAIRSPVGEEYAVLPGVDFSAAMVVATVIKGEEDDADDTAYPDEEPKEEESGAA
jgi:hypothetical protein